MKRFFTTIGLIWVLLITLIATGCPKSSKTALEDGFAASVRVASYGKDATVAFTKLRQDGAITKEKFDSIILVLEKISIAGRTVHNQLESFVARYPDGNVPASEFKPVALIFNADIYTPFIELLGIVGGLSTANQTLVALAMAGLKTAIFTVKRLMNKHSAYLGMPKENLTYAAA